ncbi:NADH dehydrogenase [ubiquinone] iron-sulfur protein 4, mitochondrial-like [Amphibalanus amphitrite]|uniref:NADH dehydrogenase [ubiquinone] iron-sulfur protein 4, mitochondrial-like n=1 Tax=Amphibalanus amphitrite TaxID=1232801 RepID=UPI001C9138AF|nr:NADH dehydrogenase [ubiquinone] iron-sulfur protein 4, mitochondrial-like [Amphibalanus amphitrite]XP_043244715.1 NADH dehydrogenase [ubiquinone] iron-sulfur protein 4, mitochondrial-like [Amphibalanus amphitrite]XP_043244716.1 NADH dehydrogenase [ubiquinone] iron-sulfur protein 4, mitochondrial-like [Amphibalanus amphitrite]XP_043244717.1 NADH dehydrogenase [ubiquinone] iron-sulfur protein 4, mitochondrial-like [Amphibalanus amphitrite]
MASLMFRTIRSISQKAPHRQLSVASARLASDLPAKSAPSAAQVPGTITVEGWEDLSAINGHPAEELVTRRVRVYQPAKNAMQSGTHKYHNWVLEFDTQERWENPLMGWASTGDPLSNVQVEFGTKEEAIEFCEKNGWDWSVDIKTPVKPRVKSYGANFSWNKNTRTSTK